MLKDNSGCLKNNRLPYCQDKRNAHDNPAKEDKTTPLSTYHTYPNSTSIAVIRDLNPLDDLILVGG
ncbi:hypothetical protein [Palaeococcus sp. (in: euryarchaeotes)]|nr:MAG: hypothetical protein DRN39_01595 [Thermococci archaeon]